jgi:imidazole glycerol-phosphate synthase subunit HisH
MHNLMNRSMSIAIVDHGLSNINSIVNMLKYLNYYPKIAASPKELTGVSKIILPGVGAARAVWENMEKRGFIDSLREVVEIQKKPVLGICVGMQLMTNGSDEGNSPGFGWIKGRCRRFQSTDVAKIKIPHMAWNKVVPSPRKRLFNYSSEIQKFYFVHSFYVECANKGEVAATCHYGNEFAAAIENENIFGVQFHPEKSHSYGMQLFKNFLAL